MYRTALLTSTALGLWLSIGPTQAQNHTCPTRPPGDSTNACASTAFVQGAIPPVVAVAAHTVLAGPTSGSAAVPTFRPLGPADTPISPLLDVLGTTEGSVLYRGGTSWATLGPGTAGQVLTTGGTGATPSWKTPNSAGACPSLINYGADPTGATNSDTAWTNAIAAAAAISATNMCITITAGTFKFANQINYTLPSINTALTIAGAGPDVTVLNFPTDQGMEIQFISTNNSIHVRDVTFAAGAQGTNHPALELLQTQTTTSGAQYAVSDITNVSIHGNDGYAVSNYWSQGIYVVNLSAVNFNNVNVWGGQPSSPTGYGNTGVGMTFFGTAASEAVVFNIINSTFNALEQGIFYGTYTEGMAIANTNFNADDIGIITGVSQTNNIQLAISNSQFNTLTASIFEQTCISATTLTGDLFLVPYSDVGIALSQTCNFEIIGNQISGTATTTSSAVGINVNGNIGSFPGVITGNELAGFPGIAIVLGTTSNHVNVQSNIYFGNGSPYTDLGTSNTIGGGSP